MLGSNGSILESIATIHQTTSIEMPPFMNLYGYDTLSFIDLVLVDSRMPEARIGQEKPKNLGVT